MSRWQIRKEDKPLPHLSRRKFLGGAAGLGAAAALPLLPSASPAAVGTPVLGGTVSLAAYPGASDYVAAAQLLDSYVNLPLATTIQKIYLQPGVFPTSPGDKMAQLSAVGCEFLISVQPSKTMSSAEQTRLANYLAMVTNAGMKYRVLLSTEANNRRFTSRQGWQAYWSYYAPVIKDAGLSLGYSPGCNPGSIYRAEKFFPSNPTPDELWPDFYATSFRGGVRIDPLIAIGQGAGVPVGLAEWGWYSGRAGLAPMTMPWWNAYCNYLTHLAANGDFGLGAIYFDNSPAGHTLEGNTIGSASDPRIPGIHRVCTAVKPA